MPKKKDKKKQGLGEKKNLAKMKKKLAKEGDDIDAILGELMSEETKQTAVNISPCAPPSARCNGSFTAHPTEDRLIMFGGEHFDGKTSTTFGDLFVYNIAKHEFKTVQSPNAPLPRNSHQACMLPREGGQMWIFGGEFTSPRGDFRHYNDLWSLSLSTYAWEQVKIKGGPQARSGHRMVAFKNMLYVFGGFYDNAIDINYFNDLYIFDIPNMRWGKVAVEGSWPSPRAGFQFMLHEAGEGAILYGGVRSVKVKGGLNKSEVLNDMWFLSFETLRWTKVQMKGDQPSLRAGMVMTLHKNRAILFGGVHDVETDTELQGQCFNDMFAFNLNTCRWSQLKCDNPPLERRHAQIASKGNTLLLFGGVHEGDGDKEITLGDMHKLNLSKADQWSTLIQMDVKKAKAEWHGSDDEEEEELQKKRKGKKPDDEEDEAEEEKKEPEEVRVDTPMSMETLKEFFSRTQEYWTSIVTSSDALPSQGCDNKEAEQEPQGAAEQTEAEKDMAAQLETLRAELAKLQVDTGSSDAKANKEYVKALRKAAFAICEARFNQVWAEEAAANMESDSDDEED